eukprot:CAMPEP_0170554050 /NCGR_PEP_ID=MMETSP0211-20121228/11918_1 /TAXON_ID=311385 /ORGANISM="Pseudokeronopsis sp., Strain OXSARD2" /LENGTH=33 /DNA_ID= /DNA_START= /DNA_END= /DNA_ORIENTATION=
MIPGKGTKAKRPRPDNIDFEEDKDERKESQDGS